MSKRIVGMEQATAIGKLRVEFEGGNPYRSHGSANPSLSGDARVLALRALRDGEDTSAWSYWFAPYCGGAVRITSPTEVRWDTAGSLTV